MQTDFETIADSSEVYPIEYAQNFVELEYAVQREPGKESIRAIRALMLTKQTDSSTRSNILSSWRPCLDEPVLHAGQHADVTQLYPGTDGCREVLRQMDRGGRFLNDHLKLLFG